MIRRLRIACVGMGMFMLPACIGNNHLSDPHYTGGGPGYVLMNRPGVPPGMYQRSTPDRSVGMAKQNLPVADEKFGAIIPPEKPQDMITVAETARQPMPAEPEPVQQAKVEQPIAVSSPLSDRTQWPKIVVDSADGPKELAAPKDLIAPKWPHFGAAPVEEKNQAQAPNLLPALDSPPPEARRVSISAPPRTDTPPIEPVEPLTTGTSMKPAEPVTRVLPAAANTESSTPSAQETTLIRVTRAFQNNRPEEAVELLKLLDPTNQEVLLNLMPAMVRLGEGNLNKMAPDELAMLIDRLHTATGMLKSKASLRIDRAVFCRGVRKFADMDPYDSRHEFRPGDMVFLYAELKNFTCEPREPRGAGGGGLSADPRTAQPGVAIRLGASLELRDVRNNLVWRTDLSKNDVAQTPPQDYYHTYRFCVPEKLPPGTYTLWLTVIDKPTNRAIRKPIELRVGQG